MLRLAGMGHDSCEGRWTLMEKFEISPAEPIKNYNRGLYEEGVEAARTCFDFLKPGGYVRCAVPDGFFEMSGTKIS